MKAGKYTCSAEQLWAKKKEEEDAGYRVKVGSCEGTHQKLHGSFPVVFFTWQAE